MYDGASKHCAGVFYGGSGYQLAANLVFILFILAWAGGIDLIIFGGLKFFRLLRVSSGVEDEGMDASEHGLATGIYFLNILNYFMKYTFFLKPLFLGIAKKPKAATAPQRTPTPQPMTERQESDGLVD